jgi:rod shape-determining protein MreC
MALSRSAPRRRSVLVLLVLTSLTLITVDVRGGDGGPLRALKDASADLFAPAQEAVDDALAPVADWFDGVVSAGDLRAENRRLRRRLEALEGRAARSRAALAENRQLRALARLPFLEDVPAVVAEVVAGAPGNFEATLVVNKGRADGVTPGMPVVTGAGLVGRISDASRRRATVLLITDRTSGVAVRLVRSGGTGVAQGRPGGRLRLDFVTAETPVRHGELVVTAGLQNSAFPAGIPVARVASVRRLPGELTKTIELTPTAEVGRLALVKVLQWPQPGGGG